jgi:hypothetical protein
MTASAPSSSATTARGLAPAVLVGGAFALTTIANTLFHVAFSIWDIRDDFGAGDRSPEEQLPVIVVIGVIGLLVALGVGKWLSGDRAPRGAVVLGALSILTLPVFFPARRRASARWRPCGRGLRGVVHRRAEHRAVSGSPAS